ncbi:MAG: DCC1-like thiol-disulfide oxidoreductase family protein [bacterium]|nr:DCC1-like thiol-disulfide oxidoreductase family protein [bacterium]
MNDSLHKPTIVYDGECSMCVVVMKKIDSSSIGSEFKKINIHQSLPAGVTHEEVKKEIHFFDRNGKIYKGSEAIIKILDEYSRFKLIAKIGTFPGIKHLLSIGYKFVAANRHFIFGSSSRIFWLKIVLACGFISGLLLSVKLWLHTRFYPLTPLIPEFPTIQFPYDYAVFSIILILLVSIIFSYRPRKLIFCFLILLLGTIILDQSRWQPWVYQYAFMFIALGLYSWNHKDTEKQNSALTICRFIIASIYIWSGLQKINPGFILHVFPWMIEPVIKFFPTFLKPVMYSTALLVPFIEAGIGLFLLTKKFRNVGVVLAILMHLNILFLLGPLLHNWNNVVWPWNIAMILIVAILFWNSNTSFKEIIFNNKSYFHYIVVVLFGIMPLFSFFGMWDSYLSSTLYSGNIKEGTIYVSSNVKSKLSPEIQVYAQEIKSNEHKISIYNWSFGELNVPPYPEERIFKNITQYVCSYASEPNDVQLKIETKNSLLVREQEGQYFSCE